MLLMFIQKTCRELKGDPSKTTFSPLGFRSVTNCFVLFQFFKPISNLQTILFYGCFFQTYVVHVGNVLGVDKILSNQSFFLEVRRRIKYLSYTIFQYDSESAKIFLLPLLVQKAMLFIPIQ